MIGIGPFEILIVLAVLLLIVGPERMPEIVRFLSRVLREIRVAAGEMRQQVEELAALDDVREQANAVRDSLAKADVREDLRLLADPEADRGTTPPAAPEPPATEVEAADAPVQGGAERE